MTTETQAPEGADNTVVMRQALEALELSSPHKCGQSDDLWLTERRAHADAIAALRAALAAQPQAAREYRQANPLGGPAKVFRAMADAIEAGDSYEDTLRRFEYAEVRPSPAEAHWDVRCAACDKPAVTSGGVFPTCPCGSKSFNAAIGVAHPQPKGLTITPLEEQQMFDDWCPYKGNPDPRVVWAAAIEAVNGMQLLAARVPAPAPVGNIRCAACDKPAITINGVSPACPCGSGAFKGEISYAPIPSPAPAPEFENLRRDYARALDTIKGHAAQIGKLEQHIRELRAFQAMVNRYAPEFSVDPDAPRDVWYWQGDGRDHLESMVHQLPVVIRAEQLRELLAAAQAPAVKAEPASWHDLRPPMLVLGRTYKTASGKKVRMVSISNAGTEYESMADEDGHHRYSRSHSRIVGRCTGSPNDDPLNIPFDPPVQHMEGK